MHIQVSHCHCVILFRCVCLLGYEGSHCEHDINECDTLKLCGSGTQSCMDNVNAFECECRPGFTGIYCDVKDTDAQY